MSEQPQPANEDAPGGSNMPADTRPPAKKFILPMVGCILVGALAGFLYWTTACPCDRTPGFYLFGDDPQGPVDNWSFANDVPLCTLQIYAGWRPHAINLNCMATPSGELFLSCSVCESKYWASQVESNEPARLRLNGTVYPVTVNRITDPGTMDRSWRARVNKLQVHGGGPFNPIPPIDAERPGHWWTFQITSRSS